MAFSVQLVISPVAIGGSSQLLKKDIELSQSPDSGETFLKCGLSVSFPDLLLGSVVFCTASTKRGTNDVLVVTA